MEDFKVNLKQKVNKIFGSNPSLRKSLQPYKKKQVWNSKDEEQVLAILTSSLVSSSHQSIILTAQICGPLTVDLFQRSICNEKIEKLNEWEKLAHHERICIAFGYLTDVYIPCLSEFVVTYMEKHGPPFQRLLLVNQLEKSASKKRKKMIPEFYAEVLKATYLLLTKYPSLLQINWRWSVLVNCLQNNEKCLTQEGRWYLEKCLSLVAGLSNGGKNKQSHFEEKFMLTSAIKHMEVPSERTYGKSKSDAENHLTCVELSSNFVSVCDVLLHKENNAASADRYSNKNFVVTDSLRPYLQALALAVSQGRAVLLEGPVGCGKTALVEYLAEVTGHSNPPHLTKVQLSDDTDSKTLTGTYVCSNIPGQFYWQPGLLVQACKEGYWVLLEDIDMAPMDVISLLLPIVESGQFSVPGHYNKNIDVSSRFRLFMTRRSSTSSSLASSVGVNMITKHAKTIKLNLIPEEDLKKVITTKFPNLSTVVDKLLTIYHNLKENKNILQSSFLLRKPSTRDLLKWCQRVSNHICQHGVEDISLSVALSAMDCFVASCPRADTRLLMTETIAVELNISADKAAYYCQTYKPDVGNGANIFRVGNSSINKVKTKSDQFHCAPKTKQPFAFTRHSSVLLERITSCVGACEPVLLVGETGVGKTSALQYLAQETGRKLHVINMSQQSSSSDLLGGYKPAQLCHLIAPVREQFEQLFPKTFSMQQNVKFLTHIQTCFVNRRYYDLWKLMVHSCKAAVKMHNKDDGDSNSTDKEMRSSWQNLLVELNDLRLKLKSDSPIAFNFVEGKLAQCIERGDWLLLDEINLASTDTLECLSCVLESESGSIVLMERGDAKPLVRRKEFRLFAAMNPATDVGKRNLPEGVQNRFTEIFVDEPTDCSDIATIVAYYLNKRTVGGLSAVDGIVQFYLAVRKLASEKLVDGAGRKPHYSLRTLCRALRYVVDNSHVTLLKALYEGFCLSFLTALDRSSHPLVVKLIVQHILGRKNLKAVISHPIPKPDHPAVEVQGHHIRSGDLKPDLMPHYILTSSVNKNLKDLARPVSYGKYPILIQGETSTGKTSLIKYLAAATGNKVIRINNHEHTDLQEYVGYYASDKQGKLIFQDGPLVTAMREGHWVILDELNLAPTDILEALNRVLDDNRELFITETQEVVHAHPRFTLFATQNPPGLYGGRKILSRAFRNRFVELHFDEIPTEELQIILNKRCNLSPNHSKKLIKVMLDLQARRKASGLFSGKHGFMTLRDLFRWAERHRRFQKAETELYDWEQHLVDDGFLLLASKVRKLEEEKVIEEVLKKHFSRAVDHDRLFGLDAIDSLVKNLPRDFDHVVWTKPMRRLYVTVERALRFDEPVLLVGETGGGKTTACQLISMVLEKKLATINCHANTEAADFIGGLRPARHREQRESTENTETSRPLKLFEWVDGPLVRTMVTGDHILIDEISLADDSVLERLNSVLEPERTLVIPDKASMGDDADELDTGSFITAKNGFQFLATMNPGGDYGKKELSPALRNRMTEIWCDVVHEHDDLTSILKHNLRLTLSDKSEIKIDEAELYAGLIVDFVSWFKLTLFGKRFIVSVRDLITWTNFMRGSVPQLDPPSAYVHAACLVYIDGLGSGLSGAFAAQSAQAHAECLKFVLKQLEQSKQFSLMSEPTKLWLETEINGESVSEKQVVKTDTEFGIEPFRIKLGPEVSLEVGKFSFGAHTTSINALRVMRALQLPRPILLEGSPGGGKTSLVAAIARAAGFTLVRINLSEQTDASDLFGADLPLENGKGGEFSWRDGPLLAAMKAGHWVVLDELNLASQSVLESLNSVFDHRGELYVPELDRCFEVDRDQTKIFACQNPLQEGGGRKGLPKSFLNRFTQVHVDNLSKSDLLHILTACHPELPGDVLGKMVSFNQKVCKNIVHNKSWAHRGAPWEFNLRDLTRWCTLVEEDTEEDKLLATSKHAYLIYSERLRSSSDRKKMNELYIETFEQELYHPSRFFHITDQKLQVGNTVMPRKNMYFSRRAMSALIVPSLLHSAESLMAALNKNWPCIVTGSPGSGKSLLINVVAGLAGRKLRTLSMNSAMDALELLGGYEQSDTVSTVLDLLDSCYKLLIEAMRRHICSVDFDKKLTQLQNLMLVLEKLRELTDNIEVNQCEHSSNDFIHEIDAEISTTLKYCKGLVKDSVLAKQLEHTRSKLKAVFGQRDTKGTYKWTDSVLVKALRDGDWLLVDGANFCSASVLDRLNALLEPNGVLTITERGVLDGSIPEIKPHKDFRLVFALDPFHGELSRAMRNRCVEIHLPSDNFNDNFTSIDGASNAEQVGLTWDEVNLINKSKCTNAEELIAAGKMAENSGAKSIPKMAMLTQFDELLARMRCNLELHQDNWDGDGSISNKGLHLVKPPSVSDYIHSPNCSSALRQFYIFEQLQKFQDSHGYDQHIIYSTFSRVFIELATLEDHNFRKLLLESFFSDNKITANISGFKSLLSQLIDFVFTNPLLNSDSAVTTDLPWDPRWAVQAVQRTDLEQMKESSLSKILLHVIFLQLKYEEDSLSPALTTRNKKSFLKSASVYQLAMGFSSKFLSITDLPNSALVFLVPLRKMWNDLVTDVLSSENWRLPSEEDFMRCAGCLRRISFIWRRYMSTKFSMSSFTTLYLSLKKEIAKFVSILAADSSKAFCKLTDVLENLDKVLKVDINFEKEHKFLNKIRSSMTDVNLFSDEEQCFLNACLNTLLNDFSEYVLSSIKNKSETTLNWPEIVAILNRFVQLHLAISSPCESIQAPEKGAMEVDEAQEDERRRLMKDLITSLLSGGVCMSSSTIELLKSGNLVFQEPENSNEMSAISFKLSKQNLHLYSLKNFYLVLSQLNLFSSSESTNFKLPVVQNLLQQVPAVDIKNFFEMLLLFKTNFSLSLIRSHLCSKMLTWPDLFPPKSRLKDDPFEVSVPQGLEGVANLLTPQMTQDAVKVLYYRSSGHFHYNISSVKLMKQTLWTGIKVPLGEVAEKLEQLNSFSSILWTNASLLTQVSCSGHTLALPPQLLNWLIGLINTVESLLKICCKSDEKLHLIADNSFVSACKNLHQFLTLHMGKAEGKSAFFEAVVKLKLTLDLLHDVQGTDWNGSEWTQQVKAVFSNCFVALQKTLEVIKTNNASEDFLPSERKERLLSCWKHCGEAWVWCGYARILVSIPRGSVDPIEQYKSKVECYTAELSQVRCDLDVHNLSHKNLTGHDLISDKQVIAQFAHPRVPASLAHVDHTRDKIAKCSLKTAYRPEGNQFLSLSKHCSGFSATAGNLKLIEDVIRKVSSTSKKLNEIGVKTEEKVQNSYISFSRSLDERYAAYPDFVKPVKDAIGQIRFGLKLMREVSTMMSHHKNQQKSLMKASRSSLLPEQFLMQLINGSYSTEDIDSFVSLLRSMHFEGTSDKHATDKIIDNILISSLLRMRNVALRTCQADVVFNDVIQILEIVIAMWNKREKLRAEREAEKESLYKYREKTHMKDTEESEQEKHFNDMFPTFEEDVADLAEVDDPSEMNTDEPSQEEEVNKDTEEEEDVALTKKAFDVAALIHADVVTMLLGDEDRKSTASKKKVRKRKSKKAIEPSIADRIDASDSIFPALFSHTLLASSIKNSLQDFYGSEIDHSLTESHIIVCSKLKEMLSSEGNADVTKGSVNIYKQPIPSEAAKCLDVLGDMRVTVSTHLQEWPDHPVLTVLTLIIDRILSFSVTSPLMKFISGLELLLTKAQDWECNASRHVSLANHLEALTNLIIEWRRLELSCWNRLLDDARDRAGSNPAKWWFYIYQLVEDCLEKTKEECNLEYVLEVVTSLQKYVESSNIGEFKERVALLEVFYRHLVMRGHKKDPLAYALYNMRCYYGRYVQANEARIETLRKPIEKELKEFVKIAKWNDINFYAVKESVKKTHQTLFKFMNKFSKVLTESISVSVLNVAPSTFTSVAEDAQSAGLAMALKWKSIAEKNKSNVAKLQVNENLAELIRTFFETMPDEGIHLKEVQRLPTILTKLNKHSNSWMKDVDGFLPELLISFEEMIDNVIGSFVELRALEPVTPLSKDEELRQKRLTEAKHIHARKRKALADLFKMLRLVGLSYRKGVVWEKTFDYKGVMLTPSPCKPPAPTEGRCAPLDQVYHDAATGAQEYFYKMVSRWSSLMAAALQPNKMIIGPILVRCRGFVAHLVSLSLDQRREYTQIHDAAEDIEELQENLKEHLQSGNVSSLPLHEETVKDLFNCNKAANSWIDTLSRFKQLLLSCRKETRVDQSEDTFLLPNSAIPRAARCCHGDELWEDVMDRVTKEMKSAESMTSSVSEEIGKYCQKSGQFKPGVLVKPSALQLIGRCSTTLQESSTLFCGDMVAIFDGNNIADSQPTNPLLHSPLISNLLQGKTTLTSCLAQVQMLKGKRYMTSSHEVIMEELNVLLSQIMLAVQQLVKNNTGVEDAIPVEADLLEHHFIHHLHQRSSDYSKHLNVTTIHANLIKLMDDVRKLVGPSGNEQILSLLFHSLVPLLKEYASLLRHVSTVLCVVNRTTCKFTYILACIAAEVVSKGFCPPAEFEEEMQEEDGGFKEVDDAGIGEGEGRKDVSDQIEEENQVEDRPEEEKEDQKDDIPGEDNAIEMSNDFEGTFQDDAPMEKSDDEEEEENDEEELDKQMGDLGDEKETEKLDERMWGSDDEEEDEEEKSKDKKEETGKGMDAEESELAAKDEQLDDGGDEEQRDESEFNPNEKDDEHEKEPPNSPEPLELPDEMNVGDLGFDEEEQEEQEEESGKQEEKAKETDIKDLPSDAEEEEEAREEEGEDGEEKEGDEKEEKEGMSENEEDMDAEVPPEGEESEDDGDAQEKPAEEAQPQDDKKEEENDDNEDEEAEDEHGGDGAQLPMEEDEQEEEEKVREETSRSEKIETEDNVEQCETANEEVMKQATDEGKKEETSGMAPSADQHGEESQIAAPQSVQDTRPDREKRSENERKVGESDSKRSLGEPEDAMPKKLKLMEDIKESEENETGEEKERNEAADVYQHITEDIKEFDKQTRDAATEEQMKQQPVEMEDEKDAETNLSDDNDDNDDDPAVTYTQLDELEEKPQAESRPVPVVDEDMIVDANLPEEVKEEKSCRVVNEEGEMRDLPFSSIHTNIPDWEPTSDMMSLTPEEVNDVRKSMEDHLKSISSLESSVEFSEAEQLWHQYQTLTQPLSQQLSEQLRLILEPTRAAKLRGDYRTGKRLNMRKVIPYIASGFRKDKIWLRRSKPSKREYQIMVAIDDSSSMADNHTKQLAFESLAVISTALTTIESGQLSVCNFGEDTKLLHDFNQPFTDRSGASILQRCSFKQEQTKVAHLLDTCVKFLKTAQTSYTSSADPRLSQLLVIVSDGRGLYIEGKEKVEAAVRAAKEARVFLAFVILDNPAMKDSILDIKVPVFKQAGKIDIRSYMADFPFPFYVIIRNINSLPETLSEALRQWFEIVSSGD